MQLTLTDVKDTTGLLGLLILRSMHIRDFVGTQYRLHIQGWQVQGFRRRGRNTLRQMTAMPTFDRDFDTGKKSFFGMNNQSDKATYACNCNGTMDGPTSKNIRMIQLPMRVVRRWYLPIPQTTRPEDDKSSCNKSLEQVWLQPEQHKAIHIPERLDTRWLVVGNGLSTARVCGGEIRSRCRVMWYTRSKISLTYGEPKAGYRTNINNNSDAFPDWKSGSGDLSRSNKESRW